MNPEKTPTRRRSEELLELLEGRGKAIGLRTALFTLLKARELVLSAADRACIDACADTALLNDWIARAASATSAGDVIAAPASGAKAARRKMAGAKAARKRS